MKLKNIILTICVCSAFVACQEKDISPFGIDEAGIYFQSGGRINSTLHQEQYYDSLEFSFTVMKMDRLDTVLTTKLRTMGKVRNYPRTVNLLVDEHKTTAVRGTHYDIDLGKAVIPAGESEFWFPVRFNRTADMLDGLFTLVLKLEDNEHFKVYATEQRNNNYLTSGNFISADSFKFIVGELYVRPNYWDRCDGTRDPNQNYFGPWSIAKYKFINDVAGWDPDAWENWGEPDGSGVQLGKFPLIALITRNKLQELADAGTPVLDDDSSYMQLGPDYTVDYSAYYE